MGKAIAFFPWVRTDQAVTVDKIRLLPYRRNDLPGDLLHSSQSEFDSILMTFSAQRDEPIKYATILELTDWQSGMDADKVISELYRVRDSIAFSALSKRQLFRGHIGYCNNDTYTLVVQKYVPGSTSTFAFSTRRRDGATNQIWSAEYYAFQRPNHVDAHTKIDIDIGLLESVLKLPESHFYLYEAMREFNYANTDSSDVQEHVEIVMIKSAFEWLFNIKSDVNEFVDAIKDTLKSIGSSEYDGPLKESWKAKSPKPRRALEEWAREFCDWRGSAAHGKNRKSSRFVWPLHSHLAFAALLFPLLFKKVLKDEGFMELTSFDIKRLKMIDAYLMDDPFKFDGYARGIPHPWSELDSQALICSRNF